MTATVLARELKSLPEAQRVKIIGATLSELSPAKLKSLERQLRRLAHPEVPEDVWVGFEEAQDGLGTEIKDEHFAQPPR